MLHFHTPLILPSLKLQSYISSHTPHLSHTSSHTLSIIMHNTSLHSSPLTSLHFQEYSFTCGVIGSFNVSIFHVFLQEIIWSFWYIPQKKRLKSLHPGQNPGVRSGAGDDFLPSGQPKVSHRSASRLDSREGLQATAAMDGDYAHVTRTPFESWPGRSERCEFLFGNSKNKKKTWPHWRNLALRDLGVFLNDFHVHGITTLIFVGWYI